VLNVQVVQSSSRVRAAQHDETERESCGERVTLTLKGSRLLLLFHGLATNLRQEHFRDATVTGAAVQHAECQQCRGLQSEGHVELLTQWRMQRSHVHGEQATDRRVLRAQLGRRHAEQQRNARQLVTDAEVLVHFGQREGTQVTLQTEGQQQSRVLIGQFGRVLLIDDPRARNLRAQLGGHAQTCRHAVVELGPVQLFLVTPG
jgi:hypothetical protein